MKSIKMNYIYTTVLTITILLLSVLNSYAQVSGKVTDKLSGDPVEGVSVYIAETGSGAYTDIEGAFHIPDIKKDNIMITLSRPGYETRTVQVKGSDKENISLQLKPGIYNLNEVIVSGDLFRHSKETPYSVSRISRETLENEGGVSIMDAVSEAPGVDRISLGPAISKPVIRGLSFSRVMTVYNGLRFENQQWGADHGLWVSNTGFAGVEVIKGPASIIYGSGALGGVVNLLEYNPMPRGESESYYTATAHSNSLGVKNEVGTRGTSEKGIFYSFRGAYESHADYIDGNGNTVGNSRFQNRVFKADAGIQRSFGTIKLSFHEIDQSLGIIEEDEAEESLATTRNDRNMILPFQEVNDRFAGLQSKFFTGNNSTLTANFNYHRHERKEIEDAFDELDLGLLLHTFNYDLKYKFHPVENMDITAGVQGFHQQNLNMEEADEILVPDADIFDAGVYALAAYNAGKWSFLGGGRLDYRTVTATTPDIDEFPMPGPEGTRQAESEFSGWTASAGLTRELGNYFTAKINGAKGFRAPDLAELYSNGRHPGTQRFERGNPEFDREENWEIDANLEFSTETVKITGTGFINYVDNYIYFRPSGQEIEELQLWEFEQNDASLRGFEASAEWSPSSNVSLHHNSSYVRAVDEETGTPLPLIPPYKSLSRITYRLGKIDFTATHRFGASQNRTADAESATPSYHLFDAGIVKRFDWGFSNGSIGIKAMNIFNESYFQHVALTRAFNVLNPGRNLRITANFKF